jgi:uncharacterized LabA/DUF88 family protein
MKTATIRRVGNEMRLVAAEKGKRLHTIGIWPDSPMSVSMAFQQMQDKADDLGVERLFDYRDSDLKLEYRKNAEGMWDYA